MLFLLLLCCAFGCLVDGFLYQGIPQKTFSSDYKYFGLSVLLQNGTEPLALIGSPTENVTGKVHLYDVKQAMLLNSVNPELYSRAITSNIPRDYLMGFSMDGGTQIGEPVMVGLPKFLVLSNKYSVYYLNGAIMFFEDLSKIDRRVQLEPAKGNEQVVDSKYSKAFSEVGFSVAYMDNYKSFITGTPGLNTWQGGIIKVSEEDYREPAQSRRFTQQRTRSTGTEQSYKSTWINWIKPQDYDYAGYSVAYAKFMPGFEYFVIGFPRADDLRGAVQIMEINDQSGATQKKLQGPAEIGSYYGSALCVLDVNGDGFDDLLVGAPTEKVDKYNEGKVYEYINDGHGELTLRQQLSRREIMARFGTAMANLGKITLDNCDSVAISSPYENSGTGAIYIYTGSQDGLLLYSQRIVAENDKPTLSFGYSLSRAVDLNRDKGTEFLAGAFQSKTAYLITAKTPFYFQFRFDTVANLKQESNVQFLVKLCVMLVNVAKVTANVTVVLDRRLTTTSTYSFPNLEIDRVACKDVSLTLRDGEEDKVNPIVLKVRADEVVCGDCPVASPNYPKDARHEIPFDYNCGDDKICEPDIDITSSVHGMTYVVGEKDVMDFNVDVVNKAENAYSCLLKIELPSFISLEAQPKNCRNQGADCPVKNPLITSDTVKYKINLQEIRSNISSIDIKVRLNCINYTKVADVKIPTAYKSDITVDGVKAIALYDASNETFQIKKEFQFYIKNLGPSFKDDFTFKLEIPKEVDGQKAIKIYQPKDLNSKLVCVSDSAYDEEGAAFQLNPDEVQSAQFGGGSKNDDVINCQSAKVNCMTIACSVAKFLKQEEIKMEFPVRIHVSMKNYDNVFNVSATVTYRQNGVTFRPESTLTFEENTAGSYYSIVAIIVGVLVGLLLLAAAIFGLYKCNFFKRRRYEEMMEAKEQGEQLDNLATSQENIT